MSSRRGRRARGRARSWDPSAARRTYRETVIDPATVHVSESLTAQKEQYWKNRREREEEKARQQSDPLGSVLDLINSGLLRRR